MRLENDLDLGRLRAHSDVRAKSKAFVGFISLILLSELHKTMSTCNLYKSMTMQQLIRALSKLRVHLVAGERIMMPLSKTLKDIFDAFSIAYPV
ncbi:MAG: hypothetical protein FWG10_01265 [Eubacteriaceae bacterium]|nr:hypothetical protein [Eubacteriaceae bacterium]